MATTKINTSNASPSSSSVLPINYPGEQSRTITSTIQVGKKEIRVVLADESLKGWEKYKALIAEDQQEVKREPLIPARRVCNFGGMESSYTVNLAENDVFIADDEILKMHSMQFLSKSPFVNPPTNRQEKFYSKATDEFPWEQTFNSLNKRLLAIAVTETGKYVILQQAVKSCVPTCVGMLVLDHGKKPDYDAIKLTNLANKEAAMEWIRNAGLTPQLTELSNTQDNITDVLVECLAKNGSGILSINHPNIGGHVIVLDEISKSENTATIRDSFHGWALTIKLDSLLSWIYKFSYFIQISSH